MTYEDMFSVLHTKKHRHGAQVSFKCHLINLQNTSVNTLSLVGQKVVLQRPRELYSLEGTQS